MDDVLILTGSKNRVSLPLLKWIKDPIVFIEPQEEKMYREAHPNLQFVVMGKNDGGFAYMMNQLVDYALKQNKKYFVFTDDDVTAFKIRPTVHDKFISIKDDDVRDSLAAAIKMAEAESLAQLAISFSGQSWGTKKKEDHGVGAWGVHISNADVIKKTGGFDEKLLIFNDWDVSAKLLQIGYHTKRTNLLTFVHKMKSMKGGAEEVYKQKQSVREAAERVASRYPGVCRVVYVPEHDLHEIRFTWRNLNKKE